MAKCRINSLTPPCGYNIQGIRSVQVMDFDDFGGFQFQGDGLEDTALVEKVFGSNAIGVPAGTSTKYTSTLAGKIYAHSLESFIPDLSAQLSASLDLAKRHKFVVIFTANNGRRFAFGYETGATLGYTNQTADALGSVLTLSAASIYPLFEILGTAEIGEPRAIFDVDFDFGAYCEVK